MREYQVILEATGNESSVASRVTGCDNWEDLAALAQEAEVDYVHQGNGVVRRLSRTIGDYKSALQALAGLLPTDSNMSIMSGGVKLLLRVSGNV